MTYVKKWVLRLIFPFFFLGMGLHASAIFALEPENIKAAIQKTEAIVLDSLAHKRIPGAAIAVVYQNQIIFMQGYGQRKIGEPDTINVDTVFQLGSVSKPVAATLAAILETQGLLSLDDPVVRYLPNFSLNSNEPSTTLKIKNILNHTSGVPRGGFNNLIESFKSHEEIVDALQTVRVTAPVGKKFDYHNAMFGLFSDIAKVATRQKFENALFMYLLNPLKMASTSATIEGLMASPNRAKPHTRQKKGALVASDDYSKGYYSVAPAGGINSSVRDLAVFLNAQMGAYPKIVNQQALFRMHTPYTNTKTGRARAANSTTTSLRLKDPRYGLGWRINDFADNTLIYHGGWLKGFTNYIGFIPEQKLGIVILHNGDSKFSSRTALKFFEVALGLPEIKEAPEGKSKVKKSDKSKKSKTQKSGKKKSGKKSKKKKS